MHFAVLLKLLFKSNFVAWTQKLIITFELSKKTLLADKATLMLFVFEILVEIKIAIDFLIYP